MAESHEKMHLTMSLAKRKSVASQRENLFSGFVTRSAGQDVCFR